MLPVSVCGTPASPQVSVRRGAWIFRYPFSDIPAHPFTESGKSPFEVCSLVRRWGGSNRSCGSRVLRKTPSPDRSPPLCPPFLRIHAHPLSAAVLLGGAPFVGWHILSRLPCRLKLCTKIRPPSFLDRGQPFSVACRSRMSRSGRVLVDGLCVLDASTLLGLLLLRRRSRVGARVRVVGGCDEFLVTLGSSSPRIFSPSLLKYSSDPQT